LRSFTLGLSCINHESWEKALLAIESMMAHGDGEDFPLTR